MAKDRYFRTEDGLKVYADRKKVGFEFHVYNLNVDPNEEIDLADQPDYVAKRAEWLAILDSWVPAD